MQGFSRTLSQHVEPGLFPSRCWVTCQYCAHCLFSCAFWGLQGLRCSFHCSGSSTTQFHSCPWGCHQGSGLRAGASEVGIVSKVLHWYWCWDCIKICLHGISCTNWISETAKNLGWNMDVQFGLNGSELCSQKFLRGLNCELELTTSAQTKTRTITELSVQFWQFSPNRWFRTELQQHYLSTSIPVSINAYVQSNSSHTRAWAVSIHSRSQPAVSKYWSLWQGWSTVKTNMV